VGKALKGVKFDESVIERTAAIIKSMTLEERRNPQIINGSRKKRIAAGSGNSVQAVNQLLKQFAQMQKMFGQLGKKSMKGLPPNLMNLNK
jgi:signal recognition particle subunit SRP54